MKFGGPPKEGGGGTSSFSPTKKKKEGGVNSFGDHEQRGWEGRGTKCCSFNSEQILAMLKGGGAQQVPYALRYFQLSG